MGEAANANGAEEVKLFSKMDLAKRGAEVIARALGPRDTLTIIGFESCVQKVMPRTLMDEAGGACALQALGALQPGGGTALWDGLLAGLQELEGAPAAAGEKLRPSVVAERLPVLLLLTDGQPSPSPPAGEIEELRKYITARDSALQAAGSPTRQACKLITLGFGYDVNSKLLLDLANVHGGGSGDDFHFIPDGTMLLTTFVNLMANLQSSCARRAVLRIRGPSAVPQGPTAAATVADMAEAMDALFTTNGRLAPAAAPVGPAAAPVDLPSLINVTGEAAWQAVPALGGEAGGVGMEFQLGDVLYGQPRTVVLQERRPGATALDWRSWSLSLSYIPLAPGFDVIEVHGTSEPPSRDIPGVTRELHREWGARSLL